MTFNERLNRLLDENPDGEPMEIATELVTHSTKQELIPAVADHVQCKQRDRVRAVETKYADQIRARFGENEPRPLDPAEFAPLFREKFKLGTGKPGISHGQATVEEHRSRVEMLEKKRAGLDSTIAFHLWAIKTLEDSGARCLDDLVEGAA